MIGRTLSHYRVTGQLGAGGMGTVYRAEDTRNGSPVALKFPHPELLRDTPARTRYLANAPIAARLEHPHIVRVHEVCEVAGEIFVVMEHVDASSLRDRLDAGPLALRDLAAVGRALADALGYAHGFGVVHRDVKPENVLVGPGGVVKLLDFDSIALVRTPGDWAGATGMATAAYVSPEVLNGEIPGPSADLYSLGAILFEMIAGDPPFADDFAALLQRAAGTPPPALPAAAPTVVQELVAALLDGDPGRRPSAATVSDTLARFTVS
jgi:serine/threonine protein kinase